MGLFADILESNRSFEYLTQLSSKKLKKLQSQAIEDLITQNQILQKRLSTNDELVKQKIIKLPD